MMQTETWGERYPLIAPVLEEDGRTCAAEDAERTCWLLTNEDRRRYGRNGRRMFATDVLALRRKAHDVAGEPRPDAADDFETFLRGAAMGLAEVAVELDLRWVNERDHLQPRAEAAARRTFDPASVTTQHGLSFESWRRLGKVDIAIERGDARPALIELKCGHGTNAMGECVWDAAKLAFALQLGSASAAYLLAGAPLTDWQRYIRGAEFFEDLHHDAALCRVLYADWWRTWEKRGDPQPEELPERWTTRHIASAPFEVAGAPWELRLSQVLAGHGRVPWPRLSSA